MTTRFVFTNFMAGELLDNITAATTEIRIAPTVAEMLQFFNPGDNLEARLTIWDGQDDPEIVGCIGNPQTGVLLVNRAQENTTARAWSAGAQVRCALTAAVINQALLASVDTQSLLASQFLPLTGGTVTGPIVLPDEDPTLANQAARKSYVDNVQGNKLPLAGGTMVGSINMNQNRILALPAAVAANEPQRKAEADAIALAQTKINADRSGILLTAGTSTAYTVSSNTGYTSLVDGITIRVTFHTTCGDQPSFQLDTTTAKAILKNSVEYAGSGDVRESVPYDLLYKASLDAWMVVGIEHGWETGDVKTTIRTTVGPSWRMMDDGTIGDASSGATFADARAHRLYRTLWDSVSDTWAPVTGGRGANSEADWLAHKKIALTKALGRALVAAGAGSGLTSRTLGSIFGSETVTLTQGNLPNATFTVIDPGHIHGLTNNPINGNGIGGSFFMDAGSSGLSLAVNISVVSVSSAVTGISVTSGGSGTGHANVQPSLALDVAIHL